MLFKKKGAEEHNIWMSFADLFSGLMVVFILISIVLFTQTKTDCKLPCDELNVYKSNSNNFSKLRAIEQALKELENSGLFEYNTKCDRYELKEEVIFASESHIIPQKNELKLVEAGKKLNAITNTFLDEKKLKFHIIIEGRTERVLNYNDPSVVDFTLKLSHRRAASLHRLWYDNNLLTGDNIEVYDAGSGNFGKCRYVGAEKEEGKNRRIIVQIIPYLKIKP